MPSWLEGKPFLLTFAVLFGIVLLRAQATYWAGRGVTAGAERTRLRRHLDGPRVTRATELLNRWGLPVITVSFVTVGFQTVINAAAGIIRMKWLRYTAAMVPGCVLWALIYATAGLAAFTGWMKLHGAWKWVALAAIVVLAAAGVLIVRHVRARTRAAAAGVSPAAPESA